MKAWMSVAAAVVDRLGRRRALSGSVFLGVCELSMILGSLSANGCGYFPVLLVVWHGASSTGACWPFGGAGSWH